MSRGSGAGRDCIQGEQLRGDGVGRGGVIPANHLDEPFQEIVVGSEGVMSAVWHSASSTHVSDA